MNYDFEFQNRTVDFADLVCWEDFCDDFSEIDFFVGSPLKTTPVFKDEKKEENEY